LASLKGKNPNQKKHNISFKKLNKKMTFAEICLFQAGMDLSLNVPSPFLIVKKTSKTVFFRIKYPV